ncbi:MAG: YihY/virulence factor BrkB family protein [Anaerolineae bacterium]|nr:YihY/virulence factor BrkB family protein [Anaerolineae bacterium]
MDAVKPSTDRRTQRFYQRYVDAAQNTGKALWDRANKLTGGYVAYLAQAVNNFRTQGVSEAVIFGYWTMFSLFPLVMLGVVLATFLLGPDTARYQVYEALNRYIPGASTTLIRENIDQAIAQRGGFGIIGIVGLVYGATGLFTNLQANLSRIFRDKQPRLWPIQVVIGVIMIAVLAVMIMTSIVVSATFSAVGMAFVGDQSPLMNIGAALIPLTINVLLFLLMFRFIPQRNIGWRPMLLGAILAALLWELAKNLFGWYAANLANFGLVYGSLGTVVGLLTWTYLTGCLISLSAEIAVATDDWLGQRPPAVAVAEPCVNKPMNELPPEAKGQVVQVPTNADRKPEDEAACEDTG